MMRRILKNHPYKLGLLWALIIFILCATPGRFIPTTSWLELLSFDKWVHASVFFILVALACVGMEANNHAPYMAFIFTLAAIVYGGALEIMQARVFSERGADWYDFIANSFGCIMALVFHRKINRKIFK